MERSFTCTEKELLDEFNLEISLSDNEHLRSLAAVGFKKLGLAKTDQFFMVSLLYQYSLMKKNSEDKLNLCFFIREIYHLLKQQIIVGIEPKGQKLLSLFTKEEYNKQPYLRFKNLILKELSERYFQSKLTEYPKSQISNEVKDESFIQNSTSTQSNEEIINDLNFIDSQNKKKSIRKKNEKISKNISEKNTKHSITASIVKFDCTKSINENNYIENYNNNLDLEKKKIDNYFDLLSDKIDKLTIDFEAYIIEKDKKEKEQDNKIKEQDNKIKEQDNKIKEQDNKIKEQDNKIKEQEDKIEKLVLENSDLKLKNSEILEKLKDQENQIQLSIEEEQDLDEKLTLRDFATYVNFVLQKFISNEINTKLSFKEVLDSYCTEYYDQLSNDELLLTKEFYKIAEFNLKTNAIVHKTATITIKGISLIIKRLLETDIESYLNSFFKGKKILYLGKYNKMISDINTKF